MENFETIDKTIRKYIKTVLKIETVIDKYVPNTHIAEVFKDVLICSEFENEYPNVYHNVKYEPYDSLRVIKNIDKRDFCHF